MRRRHFHTRTLALFGAAAAPWPAHSQTRPAGPGGFPTKPIKVIVPYPAGGIVDAEVGSFDHFHIRLAMQISG